MRLLDKLLGRTPPAPAPALILASDPVATIVAEPQRPFINTRALERAGKRPGMWVINSANEVGILTGCRLDGLGEVTLQRADGCTMMELDEHDKAVPVVRVTDLDALRQADIEEIPHFRRGDDKALLAMGYRFRGVA